MEATLNRIATLAFLMTAGSLAAAAAGQEPALRKLDQLIERADPAWPEVKEWLAGARNKVEVLPVKDDQTRGEALVAVQSTTRSTMGAIVYETGGILIDHGWIRILGSGHPRLPRSLGGWNAGRSGKIGDAPTFLLVADDALGGFFAVDGGSLGLEPGKVAYFAPDSQSWENLGVSYTKFIQWCLSGDLESFYQGRRWPGWLEEVAKLQGDQGYSIYPPLFTKGPPIGERSRKAVPLAELYDLALGQKP
jgi:hypothetical protein